MIRNLLFVMTLLSSLIQCHQEQSWSLKQQKVSSTDQQFESTSGLVIDNGINRGINYTDPQGTDLSIRYIPITITNDTTVSINLQLAFSKEYFYPSPDIEEQFKLIPMPEAWALDGIEITDSMMNEIHGYIQNPEMQMTINPEEQTTFAIGSIYPRPAKTTGVLPRRLFALKDTTSSTDCDWQMKKELSSKKQIPLDLKIIFGEQCRIISCGQVFYANPLRE